MATAKRWRRFGHDRLYVTAADGAKLGHLICAQTPRTMCKPTESPSSKKRPGLDGGKSECHAGISSGRRSTAPAGTASNDTATF
jgi:hypothetical protein